MSGQLNFPSSPTSTTSQLEYPQIPPPEYNVKNELANSSITDANKTKQTLLFCHICDYPMAVRVALNPCNHIMCYSCYTSHPNECKLCEEDIVSINRIPDNEVIIYVEDSVGLPIYRPDQMEQI